MEKIDKSDGSGCVGCLPGATCDECIHKESVVEREKRFGAERAKRLAAKD